MEVAVTDPMVGRSLCDSHRAELARPAHPLWKSTSKQGISMDREPRGVVRWTLARSLQKINTRDARQSLQSTMAADH